MDRVLVRVRVDGRHGFPHERLEPQPFEVEAELRLDLARAATSDALDDTVDYAEAVREITRIVERESYMLIEALADAIAVRLIGLGAESVRVRIAKPKAAQVLGADEVAVEIER